MRSSISLRTCSFKTLEIGSNQDDADASRKSMRELYSVSISSCGASSFAGADECYVFGAWHAFFCSVSEATGKLSASSAQRCSRPQPA